MRDITSFLDHLKQWAASRQDIVATLLVGSFARGMATDESDIDVVLITATPQLYLQDEQWLNLFGDVLKVEVEDWGLVQSKRVFYQNQFEVEFSFTTSQWAAISPVDAGTRRVISDGVHILSDPQGMLAALIDAVNAENAGS